MCLPSFASLDYAQTMYVRLSSLTRMVDRLLSGQNTSATDGTERVS